MNPRACWQRLLAWSCLAALSCTGDADLGRERSTPDSPAAARDAGRDAAEEPPPPVVDAGQVQAMSPDAGPAPLVLEFRASGTVVTELSVSCPESCVSVELAAHGGTPPYDFSWDDASTNPQRMLCASADTTFHATLHDARAGSQTNEIVLHYTACRVGHVCAKNSSFEGAQTFGPAEWLSNAFDASPWDACRTGGDARNASAKIVAAASGDEFPAPTDGDSYLYVEAAAKRPRNVGQSLCAPLEVGSTYSFKLDLAAAAEDYAGVRVGPVQLAVYASGGACQRDELAWTSPRLGTGWRTYCVTITPTKPATALVLSAMSMGSDASALFIDHLVPVDGCP